MRSELSTLIDRMDDHLLTKVNVIPWSCPVPSFGDLSTSCLATLGLNPSNKEFVDNEGKELQGKSRRFHTLSSLGIEQWSDATSEHLDMIVDCCRSYFYQNPYDRWFKRLEYIIAGTKKSYYGMGHAHACHLDLIPYATSCKWTSLTQWQRDTLLQTAGDTLGILLQNSPIRLLVLNGASVISNFKMITNVELEKKKKKSWALPRSNKEDVRGFSYKGFVYSIGGVELNRSVMVLGFNHNIQSSFGVTKRVEMAIRAWVTRNAREVLD